MERIFHTPEGVRDIFGSECKEKLYLQNALHQVFGLYGYQDIETPSIEYFEVFGKEVGTIPSKDLYKFFDREGHTLVLRPDFTPSIARAASRLLEEERELRLCYTGNTYVNNSSYQGRLKESTQMGVERIGGDTADNDAEVLAMIAECLLKAGLTEFQISVGQVAFFKALLEESRMDAGTCETLRTLIANKNYFGVEELVHSQRLSEGLEQAFLELPELYGGAEVLSRAKALAKNPKALEAVGRLEEIARLLACYGYQKYVSFDLGMLSRYDYYTGIICQAYTYGTGEPIVKGGRYDHLLAHFGKPSGAVGFGISVDLLCLSLARQGIPVKGPEIVQNVSCTKSTREQAIRQAMELRRSGVPVVLNAER